MIENSGLNNKKVNDSPRTKNNLIKINKCEEKYDFVRRFVMEITCVIYRDILMFSAKWNVSKDEGNFALFSKRLGNSSMRNTEL